MGELGMAFITLGVGMTVVFLVLGILYVMLLLLPMVNGKSNQNENT